MQEFNEKHAFDELLVSPPLGDASKINILDQIPQNSLPTYGKNTAKLSAKLRSERVLAVDRMVRRDLLVTWGARPAFAAPGPRDEARHAEVVTVPGFVPSGRPRHGGCV